MTERLRKLSGLNAFQKYIASWRHLHNPSAMNCGPVFWQWAASC